MESIFRTGSDRIRRVPSSGFAFANLAIHTSSELATGEARPEILHVPPNRMKLEYYARF